MRLGRGWRFGISASAVPALSLSLFIFVFISALSPICRAEEPNAEAGWRVLLEPTFMKRPVTFPIGGAQKTVLAPATIADGEYVFPSAEQFEALSVDWESIQRLAAAAAEAELKTLQVRYSRDKRKVIEYAELSSEEPIVASAVLAPGLLSLFETTLGEEVLLVVPSRYKAYVFPAAASRYQEFWPMIFAEYRATAFPVSVEVFEVSKERFRAVGIYEEP
jgi:hypothetical protein